MACGNTIEAVPCIPYLNKVNVTSIALPKWKGREHGGVMGQSKIWVFPLQVHNPISLPPHGLWQYNWSCIIFLLVKERLGSFNCIVKVEREGAWWSYVGKSSFGWVLSNRNPDILRNLDGGPRNSQSRTLTCARQGTHQSHPKTGFGAR